MRRAAHLPFALLLSACGADIHTTPVVEVAEQSRAPVEYANLTSERYLHGAPRVEVRGYPETPPFFVLERASQIEKYPCSGCHTKPLEQLRRQQRGKKAAHWNVKLVHAQDTVMDCYTCHSPKNDLNQLHTLKGVLVETNHSYQVCAQCHPGEAADWAGGAHGKRAGGWAPPRVVFHCAECHNPHAPQLPVRPPTRVEGLR